LRILAVAASIVLASLTVAAQSRQSAPPPADAKKIVFEMQDALGMLRGLQQIDAVNRIEYWGTTGSVASQGRTANLSKFKVSINYERPGMRFDFTRDGVREIQVVADKYAWNEDVPGGKAVPMPAAVAERLLRLWMTPIGLAKSAEAADDQTKVAIENGKTVLIFPVAGATVRTTLNRLYEPETVEARTGATVITATYSDYADWNDDAKADVFLPRHLVQKRGGVTEFDLTLEHTNTYNPYVIMPVPENVAKAAGR
jgi:hypothetical protein